MTSELSAFLRSRRARLSPEQAGLATGTGSRRVPGLRREEVAELAGVSVDYYTRLEQGRSPHASNSVLDAIARALRLSEVEREHLFTLVRPRSDRSHLAPQDVPQNVQRLLDLMPYAPAVTMGRRMQIVAWNAAADAVFDMPALVPFELGAARYLFLAPESRAFYLDWEECAADAVAHLRHEVAIYTKDHTLAALVDELLTNSDDFRRLWAKVDVTPKIVGVRRVAHPIVGEMEFAYDMLQFPALPDQFVMTYTYPSGSPTEDRLRLLLS